MAEPRGLTDEEVQAACTAPGDATKVNCNQNIGISFSFFLGDSHPLSLYFVVTGSKSNQRPRSRIGPAKGRWSGRAYFHFNQEHLTWTI